MTSAPNRSAPARDNRWLALAVLCAGMLMIVLDATIVNVALPAIQRDLGFGQSSLAWVVNAYLIAFGGVLLLAGRLGDLIGRRRVFLAGLTIFTAASAAGGLSGSQETLIIARFIQGLGGAMTSAVILGMIVTMFTEPRERTRAIALYSFVASAGASTGLLAGGVLTELLNWHWIFFVNLPIGILTAIFALRLLENDRGPGLGEGADVPGAALVTGALMLGVLAIIRTSDVGWTSFETIAGFAGTAVLLVAFIIREARTAQPLLPLRIFRSRAVAGANLVMLLLVAGFFGTFFVGSLYLEGVLHFDALAIGLGFLPVSLSVGAMSFFVSVPIITRFGPRAVLRGSLLVVLVGLLWFARLPAEATYWIDVAPALALIGIGSGLAFPALVGLAMSGATSSDAGLASGLVNTTRQVGGAIGLAVLASAATSRSVSLATGGASQAAALTGASQLAMVLAAGFVLLATVVAMTVLRTPAAEPARATEIEAEPAIGALPDAA
ncbi:MAG TPA: DHA2 family efflux MFS transporter permease subunit [Candidatus Limnocylindrales bacterium]|nr:DHA2 family efflux MFS transporter permease subunit [Candidatus Limnocylindrales bacterium]